MERVHLVAREACDALQVVLQEPLLCSCSLRDLDAKDPCVWPGAVSVSRDWFLDDPTLSLAAHIAAVRQQVFARDARCRVSGLKSDDYDQLHEDPPRSATRNMPMEVRFNSRVCIRLNREIHRLVTEKRIQIVKVDPALGFDGPIRVIYVGK